MHTIHKECMLPCFWLHTLGTIPGFNHGDKFCIIIHQSSTREEWLELEDFVGTKVRIKNSEDGGSLLSLICLGYNWILLGLLTIFNNHSILAFDSILCYTSRRNFEREGLFQWPCLVLRVLHLGTMCISANDGKCSVNDLVQEFLLRHRHKEVWMCLRFTVCIPSLQMNWHCLGQHALEQRQSNCNPIVY